MHEHEVPSLISQVEAAVSGAIDRVLPELAGADPVVRRSEHADFQSNAALALAKRARVRPADLAATVSDALRTDTGTPLAEVTISGPGFLNLALTDPAIWQQVAGRLGGPRLGIGTPERGRRTVIDYSAPNIANEMHVGHLRTTIIGDCLARVLGFLGAEVIRQNHLGDWGTQFGMLIQYLDEHPEVTWHHDQLTEGISAVSALDSLYRAARAAFDADSAFAARARARVVALQAGDEATVARWRDIVAESESESEFAFREIYDRLGVLLEPEDSAGESCYNSWLPDIVQELAAAGIAVESDGALVVFSGEVTGPDGEPVTLMVRKKDGGYGYDTTDLATIRYRVRDLKADRILYVVDFTPAQIRAYLVNRYGGDEQQADARFQLINNIQDLLGLSQNPRMLSFIADLDGERLRAAADARHTISAAGLYEEILQSWLRYEEERAVGGAGTAVGLRIEDLWQAVTTLALRLWETGDSHLRLAELTEVAETLSGLAEGRLSQDQMAFAVGTGSLLVRTEEGLFGFIHRSVVEWLVARVIARALSSGAGAPQLRQRSLSQLTVEFLCDLVDPSACQAWANSVLADAGAEDVARGNAIKVVTRLRTPPSADLRGASLKGEDLSYRELRDVDLAGADLTSAWLVGTNLTNATLRDARLVGARLDEAQLTGADLRGADLTGARLPRVDLTGVTVTGSRWSRAALIDATGIPEDAPELRGAAVATPGSPIDTEFAPAAIGVRHGFHVELGRLPQVLDYSRDGGTLAIGSDDGGVLVCDTATGLPLRTLQGHRGRVFLVTYGEDVLVTGSSDGTVRIWDAATGDCRHVLEEHEQWSWPVVISPHGGELATGDADGVLRLWDVDSGTLRRALPAGHGLIFSLAFSGRLVAAAYRDGSVLLWDAATGQARGELTGAAGSVYRVAFSPARDLLATGGQNGAVRLWDPSTHRRIAELPGHTGQVYTLAFHPREPLLASGDTDGGVRVWDTATGSLRHALSGHDAAIYWVAFSPSGDLLATGDSAGALRLWDTATGRLRHALSGHTGSVWPFAFRPDSAQLAVSDDQFTTRLWDTATGQCRSTLTGHGRQVTSVRFSADGSMLATSGNDGRVRLWHQATGRQLQPPIGTDDRLVMLEAAIFSPSGNRLVTVGNDRRLNLLNLDTGRYERHLDVESAPIWAVAFSPSGEELATANDDDTVRLWYRATGRLLHTLAEHRGRVRSIAFSADGSLIATGCDDSAVRLWDAESGELLRTLHGHTDRVYAVDFGDGVLASASWDTTARIWDVESGQTRHELRRHTGRLWTAAFSPAGHLLATAGDDLVVRLWDPSSGRHLHTLTGHSRSVWSVTFDPSGQLLATGGDDGTTRLWSVTGERPVARLTLLGLPEGWAALAPDGRYKLEGDVGGQFWHAIGMCRFETGELDAYLPGVRQLPLDAAF